MSKKNQSKNKVSKKSEVKKPKRQIITKDTVITADMLVKRDKYRGNTCEKVSKIFAVIMLSVFPLLIGVNGYTDITETKFTYFWVLTVIYIACIFLALIVDVTGSPIKYRKTRFTRPDFPQIFVLAYVVWACISSLMSSYGSDVWIGQSRYEGLCSLLLYAAIFLLISFFGEFSNIFIYAIAIMAIIYGFICLLQTFGVNIFYPSGYDYWKSNFLGTTGHQDCVSGIISLVVPILFCAFILLKDRIRWLCIPGLVLLIYTQVFSEVDSAKISLLATFLVITPFMLENRERTSRFFIVSAISVATIALTNILNTKEGKGKILISCGKTEIILLLLAVILSAAAIFLNYKKIEWKHNPDKIRRFSFIAIGALFVIGLVAVFFYTGDNQLISEASKLLHGELTDSMGTHRGYIWKACIELIKQMPIMGSGPGTLLSRFDPYNPGFQIEENSQNHVDFAHNDFLQIGVCLGLVGVAIYVAFLVSLFIRAFKAARRCPTVIILLSGCIGYIVWSAFVFSIAITTPQFWTLAGVLDKCIKQIPPCTDIQVQNDSGATAKNDV